MNFLFFYVVEYDDTAFYEGRMLIPISVIKEKSVDLVQLQFEFTANALFNNQIKSKLRGLYTGLGVMIIVVMIV